MSGPEDAAGTVSGLFVYPVKGCRGTAVTSASLGERGLEDDRRWMITTREGRFLTQRELPVMARVVPGLTDETLSLRLDAETVTVPRRDEGAPLEVRVWRDTVAAVCPSAEADRALSAWLGREVRLVRFPETSHRPCDPAFAPGESHTAFADGFPLLVTTEGSLDALNRALAERARAAVPMARFRPSIVVRDVAAGCEDRHRWLHLGGNAAIELVKPCDRCVVATTDQETGERTDGEPLATLRAVRRNPRTGGGWFGQNGVPHLPDGAPVELRLGSPVAFASTPPPGMR